MRHSHGVGDFRSPSVETNSRASAGLANYFNFKPAYPSADSCAEGFRASLFGRKPSRKTLGRVAFAQAVRLLSCGVHPVQESLPKPLNRLLNPGNFD